MSSEPEWPYGPPDHHEACCLLHEGATYCDCRASDASDAEFGLSHQGTGEPAPDPVGEFLAAWDEYLDGERTYEDIPALRPILRRAQPPQIARPLDRDRVLDDLDRKIGDAINAALDPAAVHVTLRRGEVRAWLESILPDVADDPAEPLEPAPPAELPRAVARRGPARRLGRPPE